MKQELAHVIAPILTKREFLAVYAIAWVAQAMDTYGLDQLTEDERDTMYGSLGAELVFGIRTLSRAGHKFANFSVDDSGSPRLHDTHTLFPGNLSFVAVLTLGQRFNYAAAVDAAIEIVNSHGLQLNLEPLKQAKREIVETLAAWAKDMDPEEGRKIIREKHERMKAAKEILDAASRVSVN